MIGGQGTPRTARRAARWTARLRAVHPAAWVAAAATAAACVAALAWLAADDSPLPGTDTYGYMAGLLRFADAFPWWQGDGFAAAWRTISHGGRPPLFQFAAAPLVALFGAGEDVFAAANLFVLALLAASSYSLARRAAGPWSGALAAAVAVSYPPVVHLAHTFLPHLAAGACGGWSLALLAGLVERRSAARARWFGVSLGVGMLVHPSFLWAVAVPTALFGTWLALDPEGRGAAGLGELVRRPGALAAWRRRLGHPFVVGGLLPGAALAAVLVGPWYATVGRSLFRLQGALTSDALVAHRGFARFATAFQEVEPDLLWYAVTAPGALTRPLAGLLALGLVLCLLFRRRETAVALVAFASTMAALATQPTVAWLYPPLALPAAAALTAAGIATLRPRGLRVAAAALAVAGALLSQVYVSWGERPWNRSLARLAGSTGLDQHPCRHARAFCAAPPWRWQPPVEPVLAAIHADPACRGAEPCTLLVIHGAGTDRNHFQYYRARQWPGWDLDVVSQQEAVWGLQFPLDELLTADYVFFVARTVPPAAGRAYREAAVRLLRHPPPAFAAAHEEVGRYPLAGREAKAVLLRRTGPVSEAEVRETVAALELEEKFKFERFLALARVFEREDRVEELESLAAEAQASRPEGLVSDSVTLRVGYLATAARGRAIEAAARGAAPAPAP